MTAVWFWGEYRERVPFQLISSAFKCWGPSFSPPNQLFLWLYRVVLIILYAYYCVQKLLRLYNEYLRTSLVQEELNYWRIWSCKRTTYDYTYNNTDSMNHHCPRNIKCRLIIEALRIFVGVQDYVIKLANYDY